MTGQGVPRQRAKGLMWLTLAREASTDAAKDRWIVSLYDEAFAAATRATASSRSPCWSSTSSRVGNAGARPLDRHGRPGS